MGYGKLQVFLHVVQPRVLRLTPPGNPPRAMKNMGTCKSNITIIVFIYILLGCLLGVADN